MNINSNENNYTPIKKLNYRYRIRYQPKIIFTGLFLICLIIFLVITYSYINQVIKQKSQAQLTNLCPDGTEVFPNKCPEGYNQIPIKSINNPETAEINNNGESMNGDEVNNIPPANIASDQVCCKRNIEIPANTPIPPPQDSPIQIIATNTPPPIKVDPSNTPFKEFPTNNPTPTIPVMPSDFRDPHDDKDIPNVCVIPDLGMPGFICDDTDCTIEIIDYP